jgi:hypothetical protein
MDDDRLTGGCACGAVRFATSGVPDRTGLCHCLTCRKRHGAPFNAFVAFPRDQVEIEGEVREWQSSPAYKSSFCARCGSPLFGEDIGGDEIELSLGSFDAPGLFGPLYESWVIRREPWLRALDVPQHERDRPRDWRQSTWPPEA